VTRHRTASYRIASAQAAALAVALWCVFAAAQRALEPPSRRAANAPYALWTLAHNASALAALLAADAVAAAAAAARRSGAGKGNAAGADDDGVADARAPPALAAALSRRMLPTFLAANLMTVCRGRDTLKPPRHSDAPFAVRFCVLRRARST
jgi:hypothetical protein